MLRSVNPATGEEIERFKEDTKADLEAKLARAARAAKGWRAADFSTRRERMQDAARILRRDRRTLGEIMAREMGKPIRDGIAEAEKCAWVCEYFAERAEAFLAPEEVVTEAKRSFVRYDPLGPVLAIMPWNFPFWQVFRFAAPALMAGNVGLLKHASNVSRCALTIQEIFEQAGFPRGAFQALLIRSPKVRTVVEDPRVQAATLTGSEKAGAAVAQLAGAAIKKTVLELGGSDPFIVLHDADVAKAADVGAEARCINSGQSCIAAKRFIVVKEVYADFLDRFREAMAHRRVGDPLKDDTEVGPQARSDLLDELDRQVRASVAKGARLELGGERLPGAGFFYPPTILSSVKPGMPAHDEEVFGPVAAVVRARDDGHAIRLANDHRYGLGASLWTEDLERATGLAARLEAGSVFVNRLVKSDPRLPFGGTKRSGYGRELGSWGIREFVNAKTVWVEA